VHSNNRVCRDRGNFIITTGCTEIREVHSNSRVHRKRWTVTRGYVEIHRNGL